MFEQIAYPDRLLLICTVVLVIFIDLVIVAMGWIFRSKFDFIPPKLFGVMSGKYTEAIIGKFGFGLISNALFMLPVFVLSMAWLLLMADFSKAMVKVSSGVVLGFHITLLFLSLVKLSIVSVLEAKYGKDFKRRASRAIKAFLG